MINGAINNKCACYWERESINNTFSVESNNISMALFRIFEGGTMDYILRLSKKICDILLVCIAHLKAGARQRVLI